jgi:outer membrane lipoprotein SlyB
VSTTKNERVRGKVKRHRLAHSTLGVNKNNKEHMMQGIKINKKALGFTATMGTLALLTGCAATQTAIEHGHLQTSTKMSETVFLNPVGDLQKTVFVSVKNTSDQQINVEPALKHSLEAHGYKVMSSPNSAHYLLQANILKVGKMSISASQSALGDGYGSLLAGGIAGTALGSLTHNTNDIMGGAIAGGLVGFGADSLVKDINYTMITDIQISERVGRGIKVQEEHRSSLKQGRSSTLNQISTRDSQYQRYRVRVVSNADKVNLSFIDAVPALKTDLVKALVGIF